MKTILPPVKAVAALCPMPDAAPDLTWRMTAHSVRVDKESGTILYHVMTGEMLFFEPGELRDLDTDSKLRKMLADKCFLIPNGFSERKLVDKIREAMILMTPPASKVKVFTIFTTTDCNARCFYCYEMGRSRIAMNEKTAHDTAAYIERKSGGGEVTLRWFGGEPLYNQKAIGIITDDLRERGVSFRSRMVTNGYLFDEETVRKARDSWNLKKVQITLDGTEDMYNRTKAYIRAEGSPFVRVMGNIEALLKAGIAVQVRLNMEESNASDLLKLVDQLAERFSGYDHFSAYYAILQDHGSNGASFCSDRESILCGEKLRHRLEESGLLKKPHILCALKTSTCIADSDGAVMILPEGQLGNCEHFSEDHFFGSIYSDEVDEEEMHYFKIRRELQPECETCALYPTCYVPKACAANIHGCTAVERERMMMLLPESVYNSYLNAVEKGESPEPEDKV